MSRGLEYVGWMPTMPVIAALLAHEAWWGDVTIRQDTLGSPHADTEAIFLRGPRDLSVGGMFSDLEVIDYPAALHPVFEETLEALRTFVGRSLARCMIARLRPGGFIAEHTDQGPYAQATDRFHWCLASNQAAWMKVDGTMVAPLPGQVWSFDKHRPHCCANLGASPRLHLIVDVWRGLTFDEVPFSSLREEGAALFERHYREASADLSVPLDIDWELFERIEDAGFEVCIAARDQGRLIGYAVYLLHPHLHYRGLVVGDSDVFFLDPAERLGWRGARLFQEAEWALARHGVHEVWQRVKLHVKPGRGRSDLGPLFRRLGYRPVETVYRKRIT